MICNVSGCASVAAKLGMCNKHYCRNRKYGTPHFTKYMRDHSGMCSVPGCTSPYSGAGYCATHYSRYWKHGDPGGAERMRRADGLGTLRKDGYIKLHKKGHPLADRAEFVFEHRMVLYEKIGPGTHPCFHCGKLVEWKVSLIVDHLNRNRSDNRAENLVASCSKCNATGWETRHTYRKATP